ncbi:MAG: response regulator transcription factor [Bacteroidales bacterium]|nr:response regulator transcription factor [Bacteroidales bacterium]
MSTSMKIFLVEDDLSFGSVLKSYLEINEFEVTWINDGKYAVNAFKKDMFSLCILDVMLPNVDGFTIAHDIRELSKQVPIIFLTAKKLKEDVLKGYGLGADDYITKPFDTDILLAKIKAIMLRSDTIKPASDIMEIGIYKFNRKIRSLSDGVDERKLSPKEAQLLEMLADASNTLLSREVALKTIWGSDDYFTARSMDVYITKLRKYLSDDPCIQIRNIHGAGFQMIIED